MICNQTPFYFVRFLLLLGGLTFVGTATAQQAGQCGTDAYHQWRLQEDPAYRQAMERNEAEYQQFLRQPHLPAARSTGCDGEIRRVPVVVHIIHLGEAVGTGSNIPDANVEAAINGLTDRWKGITGMNSVDMGFEFCLAKRDPDGNPTNGITRTGWDGGPQL